MRTFIACLVSFSLSQPAHSSDQKQSAPVPKSETKLVIALGDSLTEGYGIPKEKAYPQLLEKALQKKHTVKVLNSGVSGSTSASAYLRLKAHLKQKPDVLILALGSNDGLRGVPTQTIYNNLEKTIRLAQENDIRVILLGAKVPPNYGAEHSKKFEKVFSDLAKKYDLIFMPFILEKVAGDSALNQEDAIHPNEKGHEVMAKQILPFVEKAL